MEKIQLIGWWWAVVAGLENVAGLAADGWGSRVDRVGSGLVRGALAKGSCLNGNSLSYFFAGRRVRQSELASLNWLAYKS